uniref:Uncharacterized protein n=1 Tax=Panagrolaimus sp. PS1159 TaxID=55785 RepID=A0AC35F8M5_9BILA
LRHAITQHFYAMDVVQIKSHYKVDRQTELHEGLVPPGEWVCEAKWSNDENCHISVPRILRCSVFQEYLKTVNNGVDISPDQYRIVFERNDELENLFSNLNINPTTSSSSAPARQHPPLQSSSSSAASTSTRPPSAAPSSRPTAATSRRTLRPIAASSSSSSTTTYHRPDGFQIRGPNENETDCEYDSDSSDKLVLDRDIYPNDIWEDYHNED